MRLFINYKKCPDCGNRLKHYYHHCGRCGREDIVNWWATATLAVTVVVIFFLAYDLATNAAKGLGQ